VAHPLTAHFLLRYFYAATVTHDTLIPDPFVLSAGTLIILNGTKNTLAEQAISFRLVGAVIDGLGLQHLAIAPFEDAVGGSQTDGDF
jgi:hypothetical protein